jgi:hypothetical protein
MPDVVNRMLISDKQALIKAARAMADKVHAVFNSNTAVVGASSVAQIAALVRSVSGELGHIQDACPAAGSSMCAPPGDGASELDLLSIPVYLLSFLTYQTNVSDWRQAAQACSRLLANVQQKSLAGSYNLGPDNNKQFG